MATEGPVSVTTLEGINVLLLCTGSGDNIAWRVDGLPHEDKNITKRGITANTVQSSVHCIIVRPHCSSYFSAYNGTTVTMYLLVSTLSLSFSVVGTAPSPPTIGEKRECYYSAVIMTLCDYSCGHDIM